MKIYRVDLRSVEPTKRADICERLDQSSFLASAIFGEHGIEYVEVHWTSSEDFTSSPVYPKGCPYIKLSD